MVVFIDKANNGCCVNLEKYYKFFVDNQHVYGIVDNHSSQIVFAGQSFEEADYVYNKICNALLTRQSVVHYAEDFENFINTVKGKI